MSALTRAAMLKLQINIQALVQCRVETSGAL